MLGAKWIFGIGLAIVAIGVGLLAVGGAWAVGLVVILAGLIVSGAAYGRGMRLAHDARLLARRPSFFIRRDYGTYEWVSYAYIVRLSEVDRKKLLSSDDRLRRWYERQLNTENGEATAAYLRASWVKRIYLKLVAPPRLRQRK